MMRIISKRKRLFSSFILLYFLFSSTGVSWADESHGAHTDDRRPFLTEAKKEQLEFVVEGADFADHLMGRWLLQLITSVELHSVESIVFGSPGELWWKEPAFGRMLYGTFHEKEVEEIIEPALQLFLLLFVVGLCGAILYSTLKVGANPHSPYNRSEFAESIKSWFLSGIFFASYPIFLDFLFGMNETIRGTFFKWSAYNIEISYINYALFNEEGIFGTIFLAFIEFCIVAYLNALYLFRKFLLLLLIIIGPVMGICLFFARLRTIAGRWILELSSLTFIQSLHAILLFVMVKSIGYGQVSAFAALCWLALLIPISGMVQSWFNGVSASPLQKVLTIAGWGSIIGISKMTSEAVNSFSVNKARDMQSYTSSESSIRWEEQISERLTWGGAWKDKNVYQSEIMQATIRRSTQQPNHTTKAWMNESAGSREEVPDLLYNRWTSLTKNKSMNDPMNQSDSKKML
jgi:hypothetical protein